MSVLLRVDEAETHTEDQEHRDQQHRRAADYADQAVTILNTVRRRLIDAGWNQETAEAAAFAVWQRGRR